MNSKPPTIPFGIAACTFSDNLSQNSCMRRLSKATLHHSLKRVSTLLIIKILYLSSNKISRSCSIKEVKDFKEFCFETTNFKRLLNPAFLLCEELSRRLLSFLYILLDPHDSSNHKKTEFNNCYIIHLIYFELLNHLVDFLYIIGLFSDKALGYKQMFFFLENAPQKVDKIHRAICSEYSCIFSCSVLLRN